MKASSKIIGKNNIWDMFCFTDENGGFGCGGIGDATQDKPLSAGGKGGQIKIPPKKALLLTPYASNRMPNVLFKKISLSLSVTKTQENEVAY